MEKEPLVSIVVITYNQSKYILETLESTKSQMYQNIELIISDDFSTDNTVEVCVDWLKENSGRFLNVKLIVSPRNTGIAANCNRGINASAGKYIKMLAGDDSLPPESILEYVKFVISTGCEICCSKLKMFGEDKDLIKKNEIEYNRLYRGIEKDLAYQKKMNARQLFVPGAGLFYSRDLFNVVGGYDERYPFVEEWPFSTKVLNSGNKIYLLDKYLYNYRVYLGSLCRSELVVDKRVALDMKKFFYDECLFVLIKNIDILYMWHLILVYWYYTLVHFAKYGSFLFKCAKLILLFSPIACINHVKRRILHM